MATIVHFKITLLGCYASKSEFNRRVVDFTKGMVGAAFKTINIDVDGKRIRLEIWDSSSLERHAPLMQMYTRNSNGILLIFDVTNEQSLDFVKIYLSEGFKYASADVQLLLVGNNYDLESERKIAYNEAKQFAEANGMWYIEASAHNMNEVFEFLTRKILNITELPEIEKLFNKQSSSVSHRSSPHEKKAAVATVKAFQLAMHDGVDQSNFFRVCVFGPENSGKTCLIATLFGEAFEETEATQGADVHIGTMFVSNWSKISTKQIADKLETKFYHGLNTKANEHIKTSSIQKPSVQGSSSQGLSSTNERGFVSKLKAIFKSYPTATSPSQTPAIKFEDIKQARASSINKDEFTAVVWDFAGQIQYLSTHTVFIRENNTVLVVFKASCDLSGSIKARKGDQESPSCPKTTQFAVIHYWLQSISSVCHDAGGADHMSEFLPTAILVATHIDEILGNIEEAKEAIIAQLARELEGKPYAKHLAGNVSGVGLVNALKKYCIFLSNKIRDVNTVTKLKEIMLQVSAPTMNKKHPLIYLKIEKELLLLEKELITTTEFHKIAVENGFIADEDSNEMKDALDYFHQRGVILHFPSIDSLVFLSPQWLEKLVAYLIVAHHYKSRGDEDDYSCRRLKDEGVLLGSFLHHMLHMFNKQQRAVDCEISFDEAVAFLVKFGFIAEISITTEFLEEFHPWSENEKRVFIVPSQLPEDNGEKKVSFVNGKNVWSIHFVFVNGFIPLMIFHHMISLCINWNESKKQSIAWLKRYEIMMVLNHGQYYSVSLCNEKSTIQLDIILEKNIQSYGEIRKQLIDFFQGTLEQTCQEFMPASSKPVAYTPCPHCNELHIKYKNLLEERPHLCNMKCVPSDYYQNLFKDTQGISTSEHLEGNKRVNVPDLLKYLRPVTNWRDLGEHLLPFEEIQIIYANHKNDDIQTCKRELFTMYMQMGDRTWSTVIAALIKCGHKNLAKDIKQELDL